MSVLGEQSVERANAAKVIIAATARQASYAAWELDLRPSQWRYASKVQDLRGVHASNLVVVDPPDEVTGNYFDLLDMATAFGVRDGVEVQRVT